MPRGGLVIVNMLRRESIGAVARANGGTWGFALRVGYMGGTVDGFAKFGGRMLFIPVEDGREGPWVGHYGARLTVKLNA